MFLDREEAKELVRTPFADAVDGKKPQDVIGAAGLLLSFTLSRMIEHAGHNVAEDALKIIVSEIWEVAVGTAQACPDCAADTAASSVEIV